MNYDTYHRKQTRKEFIKEGAICFLAYGMLFAALFAALWVLPAVMYAIHG